MVQTNKSTESGSKKVRLSCRHLARCRQSREALSEVDLEPVKSPTLQEEMEKLGGLSFVAAIARLNRKHQCIVFLITSR